MKKLDFYILKKFLTAFIFIVIILVLIIVVIDFTEKNDDFIRKKVSSSAIFNDYYRNFALFLSDMLSPITVFIATVFVTAQLATRTEIIAMLSTGMSFRRFMRPYIIGASLIGIGIFFLTGWFIPNANKIRVEFERTYLKQEFYFTDRNVHIKIAPDVYAYLESYNNANDIGIRFTLEKVLNNKLTEKLEAQQIAWQADKKRWMLDNCKLRTFNGIQESVKNIQRIDTTLNLLPKDFKSQYLEYQKFTLPELENKITELEQRGADDVAAYQIEKYQRFAKPFAIIILTCMGVIVSARKSRGGVGFQIAFGFVLAFVYILFFMLSTGTAQKGGIPPMLAVWLPNIVFSAVGVVLYYTVPR
ncbi:MAG: LptF/LptG family permease [Verrucomicrobia bacterium]|nr:LptF/LptG family permease [Cytophagales bacterium]